MAYFAKLNLDNIVTEVNSVHNDVLKDYASWVLNEETCQWAAPSAKPDDGKQYAWNEDTLSWNELPAYTGL